MNFSNYKVPQKSTIYIGLFYTGFIIQTEVANAAVGNFFDMSLDELSQIKIQSSTFFNHTAEQSPGSTWIFTQKEIVN